MLCDTKIHAQTIHGKYKKLRKKHEKQKKSEIVR